MKLPHWFLQNVKSKQSKRIQRVSENSHRLERRNATRRSLLESLEARHMLASDFGDAPDSGPGTGIGNYETLLVSGGPSHVVDATQLTLFMGVSVDSEADGNPSAAANNDDKFTTPAKDDEDGLVEAGQDLSLTAGSIPQVRLRATNTTGAAATLYGWIDVNRDGVFDNATERASAVVNTGTNNGLFTLTFPQIPVNTTPGLTYARFRLSSDIAAANATGAAVGGEIEDYVSNISSITESTADSAKTIKVANALNGGPVVTNNSAIGDTIANIGDIDGDGVADLASTRTNNRQVAVLLMNTNGTVKSSLFIGNAINGGPVLDTYDGFGTSVAALGDLDGDGIGELVVGGFNGNVPAGAVHVLFLSATGAAKSSIRIGSNENGGPVTAETDAFGASSTSIGDIDGDGIPDLAVGAPGNTSNSGSVYILRMNRSGSVKSNTRISNGLNGGPALAADDQFGVSVASLGDIDGDGVTDLAVGAIGDDSAGLNVGAVHVMLMNANGTVKSNVRITTGINGSPAFANSSYAGNALASIGDLDGDGIAELAVGVERDSTAGSLRGAVHLLYLNANGSVKRSNSIGHLANGGPTLANSDQFGSGLAPLGDLDMDGRIDLAIGARGDDTGAANSNRGAIYMTFLTPDTTAPSLTSIARSNPLTSPTAADTLIFRATFSEDVLNVGAADFLVNGTTTASIASVTPVGANIYDITLSGGDLASFNGVVGINISNSQNITDRVGNLLPNGEPVIDETYTLDNSVPVMLSIVRWIPFANATSADALRFRVNFNEPVQNVTASDFLVTGTTATITLTAINSQVYELLVSGGDLPNLIGTVGIDLAPGQNITDLVGSPLPNVEAAIDETYSILSSTMDFGDAPDSGVGTATNNYQTSLADDGPRHTVVAGLNLGSYIDTEPDAIGDGLARDDDRFFLPTEHDDEDGLIEPNVDLWLTAGTVPQVRVRATNTTPNAATLYGWIDVNQDGVFDNATERASIAVPASTSNGTFTLNFPMIPLANAAGQTYARFRLSTDSAAANSFGEALDGEVEDYVVNITKESVGTIDSAATKLIAHQTNGGPTLVEGDNFGTSMAAIGDLDGDGIEDIAVGAESDDTGGAVGANRGAVYIQFMNANGTVKSFTKIASGLNGGPTLVNGDNFGSAIASLGDLDGDGVIELAVGARNDDTGSTNRGAVHVLFMRADGTVKSSLKIGSGQNGGPTLLNNSSFGSSVANIGDLNGDSIPDLAVGANLASLQGAVFVLFMNANGTASSSVQTLDSTLLPISGSTAGDGVFSIGDLDNDGVTDIAVGDRSYDGAGSNLGAVYIVFMQPSGLPKLPIVTLTSSINGVPSFFNDTNFGTSVTTVGDLDADGVIDLAVGASGDDVGGTDRGAVFILFMNSNGTVKNSIRLAHGLNGNPNLVNGDAFGRSVIALKDSTGDKVTELAVGAIGNDTGSSNRGAIYFLPLRQWSIQTSISGSVTENVPLNTTVGSFVTGPSDPPNTYTFSLVTGTGSTHNSSFTLSPAGLLQTAAPIDFEATPSLSVRVRTTRQNNVFIDNVFAITVMNVADSSTIENRRLFYNRSTSSVFGNGSGNPINAIDSTKTALLPGQPSSFANYTNYARGLNGLIVDVNNLGGAVTASDFAFAVSNGISSSGFVPLSASPTLSVIPAGGLNGSSRIKIEFDDNAVRNTWLRVTVLANANTGLGTNDVFYFGNAVGDMNVGNSTTSPVMVMANLSDYAAVRQNLSPGADSVVVTNIYDLNKDGRVNPIDMSLVQQNQQSIIISHFTAPVSLQLSGTIGSYGAGSSATPSISSLVIPTFNSVNKRSAVAVARKPSRAMTVDLSNVVKPIGVPSTNAHQQPRSVASSASQSTPDSSTVTAAVDRYFASL
ncbi:MAG: FG-GAP-like repeat-containing protein [Pirellulaceae bacterium]|nr:FG-GAP-like repeat-containing protein [Pirellulaceae bacterium]